MACSGTRLRSSSDSFSRPADTNNYDSGDLVANSTTAGSVTPLEFDIETGHGRGIEIVGATLQKSGTAVTNATFVLWLFASSPTPTVGDNGAFTSATVDTAGFVGTLTFPAMSAYTDDARSVMYDNNDNIHLYLPATSTIYGLVVTGAAYTDEASAETFTVSIIYKQYE